VGLWHFGEEFAGGEDGAVVVFNAELIGAALFAVHEADDGDGFAALALGGGSVPNFVPTTNSYRELLVIARTCPYQ
jgi:hypothetical protein